jgi:hypothetical protein
MTDGEHVSWPLVQFSVIGDAWRLYKRQWGTWSLAMLISIVGYAIVNGILIRVFGDRPKSLGQGVVGLVSIATPGFFLGGMIRMASKQVRGQVPQIEDLFSVTDVWFDLALCSLLFGMASTISIGFCVIPGLIVSGLFMLGIPLVVEGRLPATGALIQSWNALKSQWLMVTVFHFILVLVAGSGMFLCGFGILMTGPLYSLSLAIIYHDFFPASTTTAWKKHAEAFPDI